jgi:predicted membrane channel-forming protein YqfA (hemolysin III family)
MSTSIAAIKAAGTNTLTLIAFALNGIFGALSIFTKKEKSWVKLTCFLSITLAVVFVVWRLTSNTTAAETAGSVTVTGNGNGTAVGSGNKVEVDHTKPPESGIK